MYKMKLQELCHQRRWGLPRYSTMKDGPDHMPSFKASVFVNGLTFTSPGAFSSSKEAHNQAAILAFQSFSSAPPGSLIPIAEYDSKEEVGAARPQDSPIPAHSSVVIDEYIQDDSGPFKSLLLELTQREGFCNPTYKTTRFGSPHMPTFFSTVEVEGKEFHGKASKSKKQAEQDAAKIAYIALKRPHHSKGKGIRMESSDKAPDQNPLQKKQKSSTWPQPQVDQPSSSSIAFVKLLENKPLAALSQLLEDIPSHSLSGIMTRVGIESSSHKESAQPLLEELRSLAFSKEFPLPKLLLNNSKLWGRIQDLLDQLNSGCFKLSSHQLDGIAAFKKLFESSISYIQRSRDFVITQHELEAKRQISMKELHLAQIELSRYKTTLKESDDKVAIINQNIDTIKAQINEEPGSQKLELQRDIAKLRSTRLKCLEKKDLLEEQVKTLSVKADQLMDEETELMVEETEIVQELQKIEADYAIMASNPPF